MKKMILHTNRLILRAWEDADAEQLYDLARDPLVGPSAGWPVHTSVEDSRRIIRDKLSAPNTFAIVQKEDGALIGSIGLHHFDLAKGEDEGELGYWLGVPYWGKGYATEAAREILRYAFEELRLERVWCGYYDGNERSKHVQQKLGFEYQWTNDNALVEQLGETRRGFVNLMTKEQWAALTGAVNKKSE